MHDKQRPRISLRRPEPTRAPAASGARAEIKYHGLAACLALWRHRPDDVIRIYLTEELIPQLSPLLKWAAAQRKAYHIVAADDLERLTESVHHQGVCVLARERPTLGFEDWLPVLQQDRPDQLVVYLDGVENPHNLGAILRSCAHFGVRYLLGAAERLPRLSPSACRVAEGGSELVTLVYLDHPLRQLGVLQDLGFSLLATAVDRGEPLYLHRFNPRSLLILGAEGHGMSAELTRLADKTLHIPGTGQIESLNVSVAFAVIAGEHYRQHFTPDHDGPHRQARAPRKRPRGK